MLRELTHGEIAFVAGGEFEGPYDRDPDDKQGFDSSNMYAGGGGFLARGGGWAVTKTRDAAAFEILDRVWDAIVSGWKAEMARWGRELTDEEIGAAMMKQFEEDAKADAYRNNLPEPEGPGGPGGPEGPGGGEGPG